MAKEAASNEAITAKPTYVAAPGTEILIDENQVVHISTLQHSKKGDDHILLVPQPSLSDPNDPLRWPSWKKWVVFLNGLFYTFIGANIGPIMSGGMVEQAAFFGIPLTKLSWSAGIALFSTGIATLFWIPLSVKYGRRPVFLASTLTMGIGCIWCGASSRTTFASFFVARAFAGFCAGPIEAIVPNTITDIFFLHDRGEKLAIYGLGVLGGYEIGPVLSAYIIQGIGISWAFYVVAIASFANCISIFFTMPETMFFGCRPTVELAQAGDLTSGALERSRPEGSKAKMSDPSDTEAGTVEIIPKTYTSSLKLWGDSNPYVSLKNSFLRPFILIFYPTVLWASLVYGMALAWNVVLALTVAELFAPPPYSFGSGSQGLVFLAPTIGSIIGTYFCGRLADHVATYYTRRNHGIREPEMRLPIAIIAAFFTFAGVSIAGPCYVNQTHWIGPIVGFAVLSIGTQVGANLSLTYALDSHKELAGEMMITISVIKSTIAWAFSWFINDWVALNGMMDVYFTIAVLNIAVYTSTIILYLKGKSLRIWIHEKNLFHRYSLK